MNKQNFCLIVFFLLFYKGIIAQNCPQFGDIIITEIMQNPQAVADATGEYFEIYNRTDFSIDLQDFVFQDSGTNEFTISSTLIIAAHSYLVLGKSDNLAINGGVMVDYVYNGFTLGNSSDQIIMFCNGQLIDQVEYDGGNDFPNPNGASMSLDPNAFDAIANDDGTNWCVTSERIVENGDFGTPRRDNTACTIDLCTFSNVRLTIADCIENDLEFELSFDVTSGSGFYEMINLNNNLTLATGTGSPLSAKVLRYSETGDFSVFIRDAVNDECVSEVTTFTTERCTPPRECPAAGDIIITEIMQNPQSVMDNLGEYFELYNPTSAPISLLDMSLHDADGQEHFIIEPVSIDAGKYVVFGINTDTLTNGGVPLDYQYENFLLGNAADEIILRCNGIMIDSVGYDDGVNFPDPNGASMELKIDFLDGTANDSGENWVTSECKLGIEMDAGTPGRGVDNCRVVPIADWSQQSMITIAPNPNDGVFSIQHLLKGSYQYEIVNTVGQVIKKGQWVYSNDPKIRLIDTGVYYLRLQNETQYYSVKIVVQ